MRSQFGKKNKRTKWEDKLRRPNINKKRRKNEETDSWNKMSRKKTTFKD